MPEQDLNLVLNFLRLSDRVGTAGQPTAEQFEAVRAAGYDVVINLAMPHSTNALPNEQQIVSGLGMAYVHIPVAFEAPTLDHIRQFFSAMEAAAGRRVFVHCAMNLRVSAFMYLYRTLREGIDPDEAAADMFQVWVPNGVWQQLIDVATAELGGQAPR